MATLSESIALTLAGEGTANSKIVECIRGGYTVNQLIDLREKIRFDALTLVKNQHGGKWSLNKQGAIDIKKGAGKTLYNMFTMAIAIVNSATRPAMGESLSTCYARAKALKVETPAPVETAPVATAPVATAPVATAPVETAPVETAPVETAPVETAPVETAPVETAPVETAPVETAAATVDSIFELAITSLNFDELQELTIKLAAFTKPASKTPSKNRANSKRA